MLQYYYVYSASHTANPSPVNAVLSEPLFHPQSPLSLLP